MIASDYPQLELSRSDASIPVHVLDSDGFENWVAGKERLARWAQANGFSAALGQALTVPDAAGGVEMVLFGWGDARKRMRDRLHLGALPAKLQAGSYVLETLPEDLRPQIAAYSWLCGQYRFGRYNGQSHHLANLVVPEGCDAARAQTIANGAMLTMDLINTPAEDMGPAQLQQSVCDLAETFGAGLNVISGADLLNQNFPLIHAVGRASRHEPRLLELTWGSVGPAITLVGKGVCFDTGGLDLKPASSMLLMKKDMSGAANVMGLAYMVMGLGLPVRLRVLIPAVENAVAGNSFRPGDIFRARNGQTVEINNTDAEGRLVLADALAYGAESWPDLMVSMASLTGAARVAVGPDLMPFYSDNDSLASALTAAADHAQDPLWRMPFWAPYEAMIEPGIADLDNAPAGGFAGSITAALFLRRFAQGAGQYAHFDIYGWTPSAKPARPKGGAVNAIRALLNVIELRAHV